MNAEEVVTELRWLKSALIVASVDLTNAEQRREMENRFSALVDYTNDAQAQLTRANAVIERVAALHVPTQSLVWESYATPTKWVGDGRTMAGAGVAAMRQVVRTFCRQCNKAFPCPTRTILEGGDNE